MKMPLFDRYNGCVTKIWNLPSKGVSMNILIIGAARIGSVTCVPVGGADVAIVPEEGASTCFRTFPVSRTWTFCGEASVTPSLLSPLSAPDAGNSAFLRVPSSPAAEESSARCVRPTFVGLCDKTRTRHHRRQQRYGGVRRRPPQLGWRKPRTATESRCPLTDQWRGAVDAEPNRLQNHPRRDKLRVGTDVVSAAER